MKNYYVTKKGEKVEIENTKYIDLYNKNITEVFFQIQMKLKL